MENGQDYKKYHGHIANQKNDFANRTEEAIAIAEEANNATLSVFFI